MLATGSAEGASPLPERAGSEPGGLTGRASSFLPAAGGGTMGVCNSPGFKASRFDGTLSKTVLANYTHLSSVRYTVSMDIFYTTHSSICSSKDFLHMPQAPQSSYLLPYPKRQKNKPLQFEKHLQDIVSPNVLRCRNCIAL